MPKRSKKQQKPKMVVLLNAAIAVLVIAVFLIGALTGSLSLTFVVIFGILFILWLLSNLYLYDRKNFKSELLNAILNIILILFLYVFITSIFAAILYFAFDAGYMSSNTFNYLLEVVSLLPLSISVFIYLMIYRVVGARLYATLYPGKAYTASSQSIPSQLGFGSGNFSLKNIGIGLMIFAAILAIELAVSLASALTNVQVNTNIGTVFAGAPIWFLLFASVIEPINEEIFFRGFLVPRLGIWPSAIIFGLAHYSYNSTFGIEMLAAFVFAIIAGYVYKRTGSLYPGIVAHILINSIASISLLGMGSS